ncbi:hypothetical protein PCANC_21820 [Puccinia coronata f. sp. avenae]|uniref:Uncharacterized protein n=1 Tax=Puccinia coronata f. sp. avenae TaxID=200324 RepID=A0A2N5SGD3_9BASI|nr:hypothetical protein PCANC_21820 [Puccinia coronata f. sp. avenae]
MDDHNKFHNLTISEASKDWMVHATLIRVHATLIRVHGTLIRAHATLIRVPKYPYKGYVSTLIRVFTFPLQNVGVHVVKVWKSTLIRVHGTLIRVPKYPYKGTMYPYKGTLVPL